ncbi:AraC family transcriptional regulator [Gracilimonas mengyeensis]|nr:AraC family transcriptional regulator [Gracilimonas mengyeensis]
MDNSTINPDKKREGFLGQQMVVIPQNIRRAIENDPFLNNLYLTDIGYYPNAKNHFRKREEGTDEYILIYCTEGNGWIEINSQQYNMIPHSYFIIPAEIAHAYGADKKNPWSIYWVHFSGNTAKSFYKKHCQRGETRTGDSLPKVIKLPFEERRIDYFNGLISLLESGYSTEIIEYVNLTLWQLLASFVYHDFYSEIRHQNNGTDIVDSAIQYMQEHIDQSITIEELAHHLNYSASYLYSLFKEATGYSPINYFNHLKIQKACRYLSFTDMSIKEISFELGFNDPYYFSRLFKKMMEVSPSQYRNKL